MEAIVHADKRRNLPTADAQDLVTPEVDALLTIRYPRDPSLDPQLVWTGKDEQDSADLEVEAPPIYIQEKIDARVLVENLRTTARAGEQEPELTLFESFDGLGPLDLVDFYRHEANWSNRMILGDSLPVMASLAEREMLRGKIQMVYMDPPYGIKFGSNWQASTRDREVKDGKLADASREVEQIRAFRDTWELGTNSYLAYLRDRFVVVRDLLSESGSCFVQMGDANAHLVRVVLDEVFGADNFVAEISFLTTSGRAAQYLDSVSDRLLWYGKSVESMKYRPLWKPRSDKTLSEQYTSLQLSDGSRRRATPDEVSGREPLPPGALRFMPGDMSSSGASPEGSAPFTFQGETWSVPPGTHWKTNASGLERLAIAGRLVPVGKRLRYMRRETDFPWAPFTNLWDDTVISGYSTEKTYVVQTSTKVIERCLLMCTDPGDLVLDPTCGSGTTAFVAEQWGRRWITVDSSRVALALARQRIMAGRFPHYLLVDSPEGSAKEAELTGSDVYHRATSHDVRQGFVYESVAHITLRSIANNPDLREGMGEAEVDAAVRRHADREVLVDRPYVDRAKVRVSGPFTVESLSPHRSLAFTPQGEPAAESRAAREPGAPTIEQTILASLATAGVQNGRRRERIEFEDVSPYAGTYIQAVGVPNAKDEEVTASRVGIAIGPQYGTVSPTFIKSAAREAIRAGDIDLVCILGFAFDPQALGAVEGAQASGEDFASVAAERQLGRVPVLLVRMNADLVMGEDLKKTGAGNLFTVFGEPDLNVTRTDDDRVVVTILGVDVYDPTTGEVRSRDTDHIALWMIDTDYDGESFFVRHCYFTGGKDPYKRLKQALRADIDEDAWASLYGTKSRPFPAPAGGRIAVKVINDYGDEVMKVYEV